jgi:RNA polymerase subunit RPABC4/transcription elongation factor Spt4
MKCWSCANEISDDAKFCPFCGQSVKGVHWEYMLIKDVNIISLETILARESIQGWEVYRIVPHTITATSTPTERTERDGKDRREEKNGAIISTEFNYETFHLLLRRLRVQADS